tara:strand:+ start:298 stop:756 length:459 start_codon:yes stop_codon:yes gene_type:complete
LFTLSINAQNKSLPSVEVKTLTGKKINIQSIENDGNPIIINFWATWCKPCKQELNTIAEMYDNWQDATGVKIIAISVDDSRTSSKVGPYVNSADWDYEIYLDPNKELARTLGVSSMPHTLLLDENKNIVWQHRGYVPGDEDELFDQVKKISK